MKKISKFIKKNFKGIITGTIIGVLLCGTISVCAVTYFESNLVTYDNTESGLTSSNVQEAIDELYNSCFPKGTLDGTVFEDKIVVSGDGLYKDEYEEGRFIFKGGNPNNYITFNNEDAGWRIISIEPDKTIKIIKNTSIGEMPWDTWDASGSNNWSDPATLNTYLNETYYNSLNNTSQNQIVTRNFSIGAVTYDNNNMSTQVSNENSKIWEGKIALPTVSEYIRTNSDKNKCGTFKLINNNESSCLSTGWMDNNDNWWSLTLVSGITGTAFIVYSYGNVEYDFAAVFYTAAVRPALYLSSEVQITGGDGSQSNPYTIQ